MHNEHIFSEIRAKYNTLSSSQKGIADYVLKNPSKVMISSLNDLADACGVSEATVVRFLNKVGYKSYQVFRVSIAQSTGDSKETAVYEDVKRGDSTEEIIHKIVHITSQAVVDSEQIIAPSQVDYFAQRIKAANRILIIGVGASFALAFDFSHKLLKLGIQSIHLNDSHLINIHCSAMQPDDLLIAFSHSGESREILDGVHFARKANCTVLAITSYRNASLANLADGVILSSSRETRFRSDAMISRSIQMAIIDMLYVRLALDLSETGIEALNRSRLAVAQNKT